MELLLIFSIFLWKKPHWLLNFSKLLTRLKTVAYKVLLLFNNECTKYYNRKVWHVKFCNRCVLSSKKILPGSLGMKSIGTGCVRATLIFHNRPWYILFLISSINWKFHWIYVNLCLEMLEFMQNYFLFVFWFRRLVGICAFSRALERIAASNIRWISWIFKLRAQPS